MVFTKRFEELGIPQKTTFDDDFSIADKFGVKAVQDTFNRAFKEWKSNYKYLTELVIVLNWKIWQYYTEDPKLAELYNRLWEQARDYAVSHLKGEELNYYLDLTD